MNTIKRIWGASLLGRLLDRLCTWMGRQWSASAVIGWFLYKPDRGKAISESSVFHKLWTAVMGLLTRAYDALHLEKLFRGSIFTQTYLWCALAAFMTPILPTMAVLGLVLVGFCSLLLGILRKKHALRYASVNRFVILYAVIYLVATFTSVTPGASLQAGILTVAFILFTVVLGSAVTTRQQLDAAVFLLVLGGALVSAYGICQFIFGWGYQSDAWVDSDMFSSIGFRVTATLQNPNMLGQYLVLMIPLGGAKLLSVKTWKERIFYFGSCGLMCICMILTMSRGAWLGLVFAAAIFFVLLDPRLIMLAPFALLALYFVLPESVIARFTSIGNLKDTSTSYRVNIWLGSLAMLADGYWLCGVGPGETAFNAVYPAYSYNTIVAPHSHNLFLQIVCDAGICALVIFVLALFWYFRSLCAGLVKERDFTGKMLHIGFISGMAGFLVQAMTDYSFYNYRVMLIFWVYLALGMVAAKRSELPEGSLIE
ncbi:MAG: O-antigen ligase family protein [Oscillibacter sp.]|nr:O-antigen ligase family protein [Oscillibacter sp.]